MSSEMEPSNLEQVARTLGERWARRIWVESGTERRRANTWPCRLEEARRLVDEGIGCKVPGDRKEALALIAERSARAAWCESTRRK